MKERDFINVRHLSLVLVAEKTLADICIDNQPNINRLEYREVMERIAKWRESLFKAVES